MSALHGSGSGSFTYTIKVDFGGQQEKTTVTGSYTNVGGLSGNINFIGTNSFAGKTGVIGNTGAQALFNARGGNAVTVGAFASLLDNPRTAGGNTPEVPAATAKRD